MLTKEDIIREVDKRLVSYSKVIDDGNMLNDIGKIQNNLQYYSNKKLGEMLDLFETFNINNP